MINIKRIDSSNSSDLELLQVFLEVAGNSLESFRYFASRPLSIIKKHLLTIIVLENRTPVGYGHLDPENGNCWLGICVAEKAKGNSYGKMIMNELVGYADQMKFELMLSVDCTNRVAIELYKKYGFSVIDTNSNKFHLMKRLPLELL